MIIFVVSVILYNFAVGLDGFATAHRLRRHTLQRPFANPYGFFFRKQEHSGTDKLPQNADCKQIALSKFNHTINH